MVKKIGQETLKRFGFFFIFWIIILFLYNILNPIFGFGDKENLLLIFWVFLMFPGYVANIIQNIDKLNLFDGDYFWSLHLSYIYFIIFWLFAGLYISFILTLLSGHNEKTKNIIWKFHFCFFTYALILLLVHVSFFNVIGSNNLPLLIRNFVFVATYIYILTRIKKEVDFEFLRNTIEKYVFTIFELLLTLFVAFAFYDFLLSPDASMIDRVSVPLDYLLVGFLFFLYIQLFRTNYKTIFKYIGNFRNRKR